MTFQIKNRKSQSFDVHLFNICLLMSLSICALHNYIQTIKLFDSFSIQRFVTTCSNVKTKSKVCRLTHYKYSFINLIMQWLNCVLSKLFYMNFERGKYYMLTFDFKYVTCNRKRKRSDSVLWQKLLHRRKTQKATWQHKTPPKTSITQRLRTDLGRSVGVTIPTQLV